MLAPQIPEDATLAVLVVDLEKLLCIEASASQFNSSSCNILTDRIDELGEAIGLRVDGLENMIRGKITDIGEGQAKVVFDFGKPANDGEKRRERRRTVHIPARVSGTGGSTFVPCIITNASKNGCRLEGRGVCHLPDEISLNIDGLDLPVRGSIAWRGTGCAGVQLLWQFTSGSDAKTVLGGASSTGKGSPKKTIVSGFGGSKKKHTAGLADDQEIEQGVGTTPGRSRRPQRRRDRKALQSDAAAFGQKKRSPSEP